MVLLSAPEPPSVFLVGTRCGRRVGRAIPFVALLTAEAGFGSRFVALEGEGDDMFGRDELAEVWICCEAGRFVFPNCGTCAGATAAAIAN